MLLVQHLGILLPLWFRFLDKAYGDVYCFIDDQDLDLTHKVQQVKHVHTKHIVQSVVCHSFRPHHTIPRRHKDTRLPSNHKKSVSRILEIDLMSSSP